MLGPYAINLVSSSLLITVLREIVMPSATSSLEIILLDALLLLIAIFIIFFVHSQIFIVSPSFLHSPLFQTLAVFQSFLNITNCLS